MNTTGVFEPDKSAKKGYEDIYLARQPVFKRDMTVWAYELLYRDRKLARNAVFLDERHATLKVLAALPLCIDFTDEKNGIIINFPARAIKEQMQTAYPEGTAIIQLSDDISPDDYLLKAIRDLRQGGYYFSVDNYENDPGRESLYSLANYITIDFLGKDQEVIRSLTQLCKDKFPKSELIAKRIEDYETYQFAKELGYKKFQGFFFKVPQIHHGKKISPTTNSKLKLVRLLQNENVELNEISRALSADLAIVHRLLAYINSPSLGLREKVSSIEEAIVVMGLNPLKKWLQIILLTDMMSKEQPGELVLFSAQRAYFLEALAGYNNFPDLKAPLFLLGLFSLIDVILNHPKEVLISKLSLGTELENALLGKQSKYLLWLKLVESCEQSHWDEMEKAAGQLGFSTKGLHDIYESAYQNAKLFF